MRAHALKGIKKMFLVTLPSVLGHNTRQSGILGAWNQALSSVQPRTLGKPDDFAECLGQDTR